MSPETGKSILIVAGEASGDMHGASLVRAVHSIDPGVSFWGLGGERMRQAGVKVPFDSTKLAVVGISEVCTHLLQIARAQAFLRKAIRDRRPDLVVLIDFPDFNLLLARKAKALGVPVLYYISPQVWAWRRGRVKKIKRLVEKMVVILPFEVDFYRRHGVEATFVGHPLLDIVRPTMEQSLFCKRLGIDCGHPVIGLFPGSRTREIERLLPPMLEAAKILEERVPGIQFILSLASTIDKSHVEDIVERSGVKIRIIEDGAYDAMKAAQALIVASGTVTLEAAIVGVPMVVVYKVSRLSYLVGRLMVKVPYMVLVNLVAGRKIVPELMQEEANGQRIAEEVYKILGDSEYSRVVKDELEGVKNKLGSNGASMRAAEIVCQTLRK